MSTKRSKKRSIQHIDGNVGAETSPSRGFGDLKLWVETPDGYKHPLFVSKDEAERLADCLSDLLDDLDREAS